MRYWISRKSYLSHIIWRKRDVDLYGQAYVSGSYWIKLAEFYPETIKESYEEITEERAKELFPQAF